MNAEKMEFIGRLYFSFDSDRLTEKAKGIVANDAAWLRQNNKKVVIVEGHCDERGPSRYNLRLGDRRARSVKAALIKEGVAPSSRMIVVSQGEGKPRDPSHNERAWRMNRRVELILR